MLTAWQYQRDVTRQPHHEEDVVSLGDLTQLPAGTGYDPSLLRAVQDWCERATPFAGLIVSGDTVYVGFSRDAERHLRDLRHAFPGARVRAFSTNHTYSALRSALDSITHDLSALRAEGITISTVGIDPSRNVVVVGLPGGHGDASVRERLMTRYGREILVFEVAEPRHLARGLPPTQPPAD